MEDLPEIFSNQGPEDFLRNPALINNPFSKANWNTLLEVHDLPYTRERGGQGKNIIMRQKNSLTFFFAEKIEE